MNALLEAAITLIEEGHSAVALVPHRKGALLPADPGQSYKFLTIDEAKEVWRRTPNANLGLAMNEEYFGLDIDFKNGCDPEILKKIPPTVHQRTPSKGYTAFIKQPKSGPMRHSLKLQPGLQVRSIGGHFAIAPSHFIPNEKELREGSFKGSYEWIGRSIIDGEITECPEWIEELNLKAIKEGPYKLPDDIAFGGQHMELFQFGSALRGKGASYEEILAAFIVMNDSRLEKKAPIKNLEKLALDICRRYQQGPNKKFEKSNIEFVSTSPPKWSDGEEFPIEALTPTLFLPAKKIAETVSAPLDIVCSSLLAGASVCVQPFYNLMAFGGERPISLFFLTVAESGERKSTVDRIVLSEHYKWRNEKQKTYEEQQKDYESQVIEWKRDTSKPQLSHVSKPTAPKAPILFVTEPTIEGLFSALKRHRNSVGLFSDEGGSFLGGYSMGRDKIKATMAKFNNLWDGTPIDRIRKGKDGDGEVDMLFGKRVSAHLMLQPKLATELFSNEDAKSQGFLARWLVSYPKSLIGERNFMYHMPPIVEMIPFNTKVRKFLESDTGDNVQTCLLPTDIGIEILKDFYTEIEPKQKSGCELSAVRANASKSVELAARIAGVMHSFEGAADPLIPNDTMLRGVALARYYLGEHLKITGAAKTTYSNNDLNNLLGWIQKRNTDVITTRDIQRCGPEKFRHKDRLLPAIEQLHADGWITLSDDKHAIKIL